MAEFEVNSKRDLVSGDRYELDERADPKNEIASIGTNPLDSEEARKEHRKLLQWFYYERERQSNNRIEMALDHDFYDNQQWEPEDAQIVRERGQMPLVYNEVAPMVDWIIGTERRARVDWNVLPRTEDDVKTADIKEKCMKYVSDINRVPFLRSRAFADAIKGGVGWLDDGVRDDPTQDILYSRYEDWRNVLWDSNSYELDLSDARYVFRWRWVDEDIAMMMFPDRRDQIARAMEDMSNDYEAHEELDAWTTAQEAYDGSIRTGRGGYLYSGLFDAKRRQVRLIECQYRKPYRAKVVADGAMKGAFFNPDDEALVQAVNKNRLTIVDRMMMRVHVAVMTETDLLSLGTSIFRHNKFSLTPIWCYRRNRDRLPYGVVRRVRDMQQDLNKRASKALFLLNTNQIIADEGAVEDWDEAREEVNSADGTIIKKPGKEFLIRRDTEQATGQIQMMQLAATSIQKTAGVSQENLGRQTNAVSGEAIKARQLQGSVVTTEPFDNLRYATQIQGEKQLSLTEQFYTEEKVIRLTGDRGKIEWYKINTPERQVDGTIRYINDITDSMADFVVDEQDYAGTLRQVMFESLNKIAEKLPPELALKLMTMAFEYSDLPNKNEIANQIRSMTGERDPNEELSPEEQQQQAQQQEMQNQLMQAQHEQAMLAVEELRARVREINAKASKYEAEAMEAGTAVDQQAIDGVRRDADRMIDKLQEQLRKAQQELQNDTNKLRIESDTDKEVARIKADADIRVAEIRAQMQKETNTIKERLNALSSTANNTTAD